MVLKMFFYGIFAGIIAFTIEMWISLGLIYSLGEYMIGVPILFFIINQFIIIAFVEEGSKFLMVQGKVIRDKEFDEPVDAMIYMIIVALGFAALENVLVLFSIEELSFIKDAALISSFRFLGATFLHALASAVIGYYLALAFCDSKKRFRLIFKGLIIASLLHGAFNISIMVIERGLIEQSMWLFGVAFAFLAMLLISTAIFVSSRIKKLKQLKSTCHPLRQDNNTELDSL